MDTNATSNSTAQDSVLRETMDMASLYLEVCDTVSDEDFNRQTPCTEWNVRQLIEHVYTGIVWTTARLRGQQVARDDAKAPTDGLIPAVHTALAELLVASREEGVAERVLELPMGTMTGIEFIGIRAGEYGVHAWDLVQALGHGEELLDAHRITFESILPMFRSRFANVPRGEGKPFGEEQHVSAEAEPWDKLAALMGRTPLR